MLILSHSAIFFWLLLTFIAADFIKNENENFNSTEKTNRTLPATEYKESKRFRQHKLHSEDTTVDAGVDDVGAEIAPKFNNANVDETATKNTDTIRNRHSIKTKHKHKRMWHDLSNEQKNNIKMLDNANKTSDTKELIKSNVNDTANSVITNTVGIGDDNITNTASAINHSEEDDNRTDQNNKTDRRSKVRSYDTPDNDDKPKQINAVINEKVKNVAGNEDRLKQSQRISARIATVATTVVAPADNSTNFNAPSHRKKRRRILFSSTQQVPTDESQTSSSPFAPFNTYNFQPVEQNSRRDHNIVPFLDFGRKIGGSIVPRGNVNFVDSLFSEIRSNKPPIESKSQIVSEEEPLHEDMDVTLDRKTIEKNHVPNDRLHLASTNLANYYRRSTTKPPTTNTTNTNASSTCIPPYRIRRPFTASKTLKREVTQNIPLCQYNTTTPTPTTTTTTITINKPEELKSTEKPKFLKNRTDSTTYKSTSKNDTIVAEVAVTETPRVDVTTPLASQFTTKILSTAVITSVSVKSNDDLTVPIEPYFTIAVDQKPKSKLEESRKKSKSEKSLDTAVNTYNSSGVIFSPLNKTKPIQSTVRPSLTFYQRNTSKNYRNVNSRNSQISKILSQLQSQSFGAPSTPTNANYSDKPDSEAVTKQNLPQANVINAFNLSDASIEYLLGGNLSTEASEPQSEPTEVDITTNDSLSQRPAVVIVTVNEKENTSAEDDHYNSSSTPTLTAYRNTEKNTENWRYRTNAESDDFSENSTLDSKIYAIFSKTSTLNLTRSEPSMPSTTPSLLARPASKPNSEEFASVGYQIGFHIVTYVLAGLGVIPLIIGIFLITKMILSQNKKQIFEGSEYSSEYNRNPLEFNGGVTSSPIATKLPRVPHHMAHWEIEKKSFPSISLPNNSKWEFPRDKLRLQTILGQGNFGQVWKAEADDISGHEGLTRLVAVKMVKEISSTREKDDLIKELIIMQHLGSHPNVVTLLGCCTEKEPYMLIMEYVMYGKLLSFLRDHRTRSHYFNFSDNGDTLTSRDLTVFAYCVARGMEYLQNNQIIHRDLAARNILVDHNKLCKIADFGMSRHVGDSGQVLEHRQSKGALPIRWMAPESLHYSCYTHKTDVWSFGILMWEIVTLGSMPYASMGARVVMRKVKEGYRLEKPKHCKSQLFNVISKCWYSDPNKRPTFTELKQDLGNLLEDSEHDGNYVDLDSLVEEMNQVVHGSHNEKIII